MFPLCRLTKLKISPPLSRYLLVCRLLSEYSNPASFDQLPEVANKTTASNGRIKTQRPLKKIPGIESTQSKHSNPVINKDANPFDKLAPREVDPEDGIYGNLGEELTGMKLDGNQLLAALNTFYQLQPIRQLAKSHCIDDKLFAKVYISFRRYCFKSASLPPELYVKLCDITNGHSHATDLFPFFLTHARQVYPHLECQEELRKISFLGQPHSWYPEARSMIRKVYLHSGPTNSGKTYHAMKEFLKSSSGIYCGPLKLLAVENYQKSNELGTPCDLITGEERRFANPDGETRSSHVSCTVEMARLTDPVDVCVIDEIQMIRDPTRGWAWTRALLGIPAKELHLCGEEAAVDVVRRMLEPTGDIFEVIRYKRLTPLVIEDKPLLDLKNVRGGDCIVCFNKDSIYQVSMELEKLGHSVAVVYGSLPPNVKIAQCKRFNEFEDCQVMVATDAVGMGLNLSIRRIIFHSLMKSTTDAQGNRFREFLSTSQCLQIAGRAGRYKTAHETGYVTTYRAEDLTTMKQIMSSSVNPIERAGLHPTAEQLELFAYHLPHLSLKDLIDLFVDICEFDESAYFICDLESFKELAVTIEHINIPLRARYLLCCTPISTKFPFSVAMFTKFARQLASGEPVTTKWLKQTVNWPTTPPENIEKLIYCETLFDVLEAYLWLSNRFTDIFNEPAGVRQLQVGLSKLIQNGVSNIVGLIKAPVKEKMEKH